MGAADEGKGKVSTVYKPSRKRLRAPLDYALRNTLWERIHARDFDPPRRHLAEELAELGMSLQDWRGGSMFQPVASLKS